MTRTVKSYYVLCAALVLALALIDQAAAGDRHQTPQLHPSQLQWAPAIQTQLGSHEGLAAQRPAQRNTTTDYPIRWFQDYGGGK